MSLFDDQISVNSIFCRIYVEVALVLQLTTGNDCVDSVKCHALVQIGTEAPKHVRIVCSDAANTRNEDFARSAFIIYDTPEKAAKAVQKLNKMRIYQTPKPKSESWFGCRAKLYKTFSAETTLSQSADTDLQ